MFEIDSREFGRDRQLNASAKARQTRPYVGAKTRDSFEVGGSFETYTVRFLRSDDKVFVQCECEAGQKNFPCYHAMAAYDQVYAKELTKVGSSLLNRQAVGSLGFIGTKPKPGEVFTLEAGQSFEAVVPVRITVEKR